MELREIIERCKALNICEERFIADNYYEISFYNKDADQWSQLFTWLLGPAAKPSGVEPTKKDIELTKQYGGVRTNQTVFRKEDGDTIILAMFWPWQNEVRTTLKIAIIKK